MPSAKRNCTCTYRIREGSRYQCRVTKEWHKRVSEMKCSPETMNRCAQIYWNEQMAYPITGYCSPRDEPRELTGEM